MNKFSAQVDTPRKKKKRMSSNIYEKRFKTMCQQKSIVTWKKEKYKGLVFHIKGST